MGHTKKLKKQQQLTVSCLICVYQLMYFYLDLGDVKASFVIDLVVLFLQGFDYTYSKVLQKLQLLKDQF